jgi:hypothetical protein
MALRSITFRDAHVERCKYLKHQRACISQSRSSPPKSTCSAHVDLGGLDDRRNAAHRMQRPEELGKSILHAHLGRLRENRYSHLVVLLLWKVRSFPFPPRKPACPCNSEFAMLHLCCWTTRNNVGGSSSPCLPPTPSEIRTAMPRDPPPVFTFLHQSNGGGATTLGTSCSALPVFQQCHERVANHNIVPRHRVLDRGNAVSRGACSHYSV